MIEDERKDLYREKRILLKSDTKRMKVKISEDKATFNKAKSKLQKIESLIVTEINILTEYFNSLSELIKIERSTGLKEVLTIYIKILDSKINDMKNMTSNLKNYVLKKFGDIESKQNQIIECIERLDAAFKEKTNSNALQYNDNGRLEKTITDLSTQWLQYEKHKAEAIRNYVIYTSNIYMFLNANILSNTDKVFQELRKVKPEQEVMVVFEVISESNE